ncbi:MAG: CPBP family intramembrane metalloprotease [Verrucomicrobia bacterium]|nr:CPBP family intramembrane metalloprotease [Verrucomicrobiota bacterium]
MELSLLAVAVALGWCLGQPVWGTLRWEARDAAYGAAAAVPMLAAFGWMLRSRWRPLAALREFLETHVRPFMGSWSVGQLLAISCIAGVAEESLFRAVLQDGLGPRLTAMGAWLAASLLFGLCHAVTRTYAAMAALMGGYLGIVYGLTGNLLAPIVSHALYDVVALVVFLRRTPDSVRDTRVSSE